MEKSKIFMEDQDKTISETLTKIEYFLTAIERDINANLNSDGLINFHFESRLLESILLASYFKWYHPDTHINDLCDKMLNKVLSKTIHSSKSVPALDINIQKLLFDLYDNKYGDSLEHIQYWYTQYQVLLNEAFKEDITQNRIKKFLFFNVIALFSCPKKKKIRSTLFQLIMKDFKQILPLFQSNFQKDSQSHWNAVYPLLFQLISQNFGLSNFIDCLQDLMFLQSDDGTWFNNHTLTLIVLHTIRLCIHPIMTDIIQEGMNKAEFYLKGYINSGMSIIHSMNVFNSVLFYSQQAYFKKIRPPPILIESLLMYQKDSGGWTSDTNLNFTDWDATGFAILTLIEELKSKNNFNLYNCLENSINYLNKSKKDDGSFSVYIKGNETLAEMTARGIMVLSNLPNEFIDKKTRSETISKSLTWLEMNQKNGLFKGQSYSASEIYPLSQVALAINYLMNSSYLNCEDNRKFYFLSKKIKEEICEYLKTSQNPNGSYGPRKGFPIIGEQQSTAYAVIALAALEIDSSNFYKALNCLLSSISIPVKSYPEGTGPRPIRYNDLSHGKIFIYIALLLSKISINKHLHKG